MQKLIGAQTKVKLNIPQLTLAKLVQSERHQSTPQEVPGSNPTGETFLLIFFDLPYVSSLLTRLLNFNGSVNWLRASRHNYSQQLGMVVFCCLKSFVVTWMILMPVILYFMEKEREMGKIIWIGLIIIGFCFCYLFQICLERKSLSKRDWELCDLQCK